MIRNLPEWTLMAIIKIKAATLTTWCWHILIFNSIRTETAAATLTRRHTHVHCDCDCELIVCRIFFIA